MKRTLLWMVGFTLMLGTLTGARRALAQEKDITGTWQGTLEAGKGLRTLIKISKDDGVKNSRIRDFTQHARGPPTVNAVELRKVVRLYAQTTTTRQANLGDGSAQNVIAQSVL